MLKKDLMKPKKPVKAKVVPIERIYTVPTLSTNSRIASLCFVDAYSLQCALARPHHFYECAMLQGPLRGVNFPFTRYIEWIVSLGDKPLATSERDAYNLLNPVLPTDQPLPNQPDQIQLEQPLYIIAYIKGDSSTLTHELAHAHFHINPAYASLCINLYTTLQPHVKQYIDKELKIRGYVESNYADEFQAYILEGPGELGKKFVCELGMVNRTLKDAIKALL